MKQPHKQDQAPMLLDGSGKELLGIQEALERYASGSLDEDDLLGKLRELSRRRNAKTKSLGMWVFIIFLISALGGFFVKDDMVIGVLFSIFCIPAFLMWVLQKNVDEDMVQTLLGLAKVQRANRSSAAKGEAVNPS